MGDVSSCLLPTIVNDSLAVVDCSPDPSRYSPGQLTFVHSVDPKGRLVLSDLSTYFQGCVHHPRFSLLLFSSLFLCYLFYDLRRLHCLDIGIVVRCCWCCHRKAAAVVTVVVPVVMVATLLVLVVVMYCEC